MAAAIIHVVPLLAALVTGDGGASAAAPPVDAGTGRAPAAKSPHAEVEAALAKSAGAADLQRLAQTSQAGLMAVAADRTAAASLRGRALSALAYAGNGRAHAFLENFIIRTTPSRDAADRALLGQAAIALGWQGGPRLVDLLAPLLDDGDRELRLDAAIGLGLSRNRDAEKPLRARLAVETDPAVKRQLDTALRAVTAPR